MAAGSWSRTCIRLAGQRCSLVLAVRDTAAGSRLADELPGDHAVVGLDLSDLDAVRAATAGLRGRFDAVVLNAALQRRDRRAATAQGFELTFAVNYLANALIATELAGRSKRLVLVASGTHRNARFRNFGFAPPRWEDDLDRLASPGPGSGQVAYATSKLAVVLWGLEATRRFPSTTVLLYDPGLMPGTGLAREFPAPARWAWNHVLPVLLWPVPGVSTSARSGAVLGALATGERSSPSGTYIAIDRPAKPDRAARHELRASALFDWTARRLTPA